MKLSIVLSTHAATFEALAYTGKNAYTWIHQRGPAGAGTEPYLCDGGAILWGLYSGLMGLRADFQGVWFVPHVPRMLEDSSFRIRLMGRLLIVRIRGCGDTLRGVWLNGRGVDEQRIGWDRLRDDDVLEVDVEE